MLLQTHFVSIKHNWFIPLCKKKKKNIVGILQSCFSVVTQLPFFYLTFVKCRKINLLCQMLTSNTTSWVTCVSLWKASKTTSFFESTLENSLFVSVTPLISSEMTFSSHLVLFPVGWMSLYPLLRVVTAVLWIMETSHPYCKQDTDAQMLTRKHTSSRVSNSGCANSRCVWLLSRLYGCHLFTCMNTY